MHLLVAEADTSLAELLRARFLQENFQVQQISTGKEFTSLPSIPGFDVVLMDLKLPGIQFADALPDLLRRWPDASLILLSGDSPAEDRARFLLAGADDVILKPFAVTELVAKVHAILRRRLRAPHDVLKFEDLEVNRVSHQVCRAGHAIDLSPREYSLLDFLLRNQGRPVSRIAIIEGVWRMHGDSITNVVDVYINYLRKKIDNGCERPLIRTVRGVGYQIGGNHHPH
jgi:DNA-binding response OmpR family regulator